jgi:hypothetical protein
MYIKEKRGFIIFSLDQEKLSMYGHFKVSFKIVSIDLRDQNNWEKYMKKTMTTKYFRRRKAVLARKLKEVSKDLQRLSHHIKGL